MPPIENSTSAGTPLATQNAPVQSIFRCRLCAAGTLSVPLAAIDAVLMATPRRDVMTHQKTRLQYSGPNARCAGLRHEPNGFTNAAQREFQPARPICFVAALLNGKSLDLSLAYDKTKSSNAKTKVVKHSRFRRARPKWSRVSN
jgi:hypothetical protein